MTFAHNLETWHTKDSKIKKEECSICTCNRHVLYHDVEYNTLVSIGTAA